MAASTPPTLSMHISHTQSLTRSVTVCLGAMTTLLECAHRMAYRSYTERIAHAAGSGRDNLRVIVAVAK